MRSFGVNAMGIWFLTVLMSSCLVATAYEEPQTSDSSLQLHSDGTVTLDVFFRNWTGFWAFSEVIPAGEFSVQKLFTVGLLVHLYIWFS